MVRTSLIELKRKKMPDAYDHLQLRIEVCGPVAAESPFDSGTLWGRILCALASGPPAQRSLAEAWLKELSEQAKNRTERWLPPLIISEGFLCDAQGEPWLPLPLAFSLELQLAAASEGHVSRKELKRIDRVPMSIFRQICSGAQVLPDQLLALAGKKPDTTPALAPHLSIDRLSGTGRDGFLFTTAMSVYSAGELLRPEVVFYMKARRSGETATLVGDALKSICRQGWGHGKSRGLGRIRLKSFESCDPPPDADGARGFVSLSHFCPASNDPTEGQWKLLPKHPVPAQFVNGRRVALGEESQWRVKSFLRLRAGSCLLFKAGETVREYYGRTLSGLLEPAEDHLGNPLPELFQYALSYPWPLKAQ
jgi:hypothetical protein